MTIQFRSSEAAEWAATNPILGVGEPGYETDTGRQKIGDGATAWIGLHYFIDEAGVDAKIRALSGNTYTGPMRPAFPLGTHFVWMRTDPSTGDLVDIITGVSS